VVFEQAERDLQRKHRTGDNVERNCNKARSNDKQGSMWTPANVSSDFSIRMRASYPIPMRVLERS